MKEIAEQDVFMKDKLKKYIEEKFISEQKHPELDLWIYNYTPKCMYEKKWDNITMSCRGLILDKNGNVIARPFKKFFNYEEYLSENKDLPLENFKVYEKYDGSLGILYWFSNEPRLATIGSFISEQAIRGTEILKKKFNDYPFNKNYTYLFEIIYKENRIVLDYGEKEDLILLSVIETDSGKELDLEIFNDLGIAKRYDGIKDISKLKENQESNREGYVIKFDSGLRLKLKFEEYVRLHRLVTKTNSKIIWEFLRDNRPIDEIIEKVPDEFFKWVKKTIKNLNAKYLEVEQEAKDDFNNIKNIKIRKEFAQEAVKKKTKAILFKMLDNEDYSGIIWKMIEPKAEKPFKDEI